MLHGKTARPARSWPLPLFLRGGVVKEAREQPNGQAMTLVERRQPFWGAWIALSLRPVGSVTEIRLSTGCHGQSIIHPSEVQKVGLLLVKPAAPSASTTQEGTCFGGGNWESKKFLTKFGKVPCSMLDRIVAIKSIICQTWCCVRREQPAPSFPAMV